MSEADILAQWRAEISMPKDAEEAIAWWELADDAYGRGAITQPSLISMLRIEGRR